MDGYERFAQLSTACHRNPDLTCAEYVWDFFTIPRVAVTAFRHNQAVARVIIFERFPQGERFVTPSTLTQLINFLAQERSPSVKSSE